MTKEICFANGSFFCWQKYRNLVFLQDHSCFTIRKLQDQPIESNLFHVLGLTNPAFFAIITNGCFPNCFREAQKHRTEENNKMGKYFGTDGFRGEAGVTLTSEHAYKIGRFLGWYYSGGYRGLHFSCG